MCMTTKVSLKSYNTFGVDAYTDQLVHIRSTEQMVTLLQTGAKPDLILGGGSNILFSGEPLSLVVKNDISGKKVIRENEKEALIEVGGGENWHQLVLWALDKNLGGLENLSLIPGTVGAAPIQNIGAYGAELKDVFHSLDAVDMAEHNIKTFAKKDCDFGYRNSLFKRRKGRYFIGKVRLALSKQPVLNLSYGAIAKTLAEKGIDEPGIRDVSRAVIDIRSSKLPDPAQTGNAGSFFKNPVVEKPCFLKLKEKWDDLVFYALDDGRYKIPAGWLIEKSGFKGRREGPVGSYNKQALVIVNYGGATGRDVLAWAERIEKTVKEKFGIQLEKEVNVI